jgi:hypothetical protein
MSVDNGMSPKQGLPCDPSRSNHRPVITVCTLLEVCLMACRIIVDK